MTIDFHRFTGGGSLSLMVGSEIVSVLHQETDHRFFWSTV